METAITGFERVTEFVKMNFTLKDYFFLESLSNKFSILRV
jgi:hypothetical protein